MKEKELNLLPKEMFCLLNMGKDLLRQWIGNTGYLSEGGVQTAGFLRSLI